MDINKIFGLFNNDEPESLQEKARIADELLRLIKSILYSG
jgi:hypothetical protein